MNFTRPSSSDFKREKKKLELAVYEWESDPSTSN
jgi:hypothetical protein